MSSAPVFVQYHEYFQKLHLDMQHTTDAIAQRKTRSGSKAKVRVDPNSGFDAIASTIKAKDKPLVVYVSEGCAVPEAPPGGVAPKIVLREDDVKLIREQLSQAARADEKPKSLMLSHTVNPPLEDLEVSLEAMGTDELNLAAVELQEAGLDLNLDQLVSVLASDDPLKLEPEAGAPAASSELPPATALVVLPSGGSGGLGLAEEPAVGTMEKVGPPSLEEMVKESAGLSASFAWPEARPYGSEMGETASTVDLVETNSDCAASTAGDCAAMSDAGSDSPPEMSEAPHLSGCATPPVPPSPPLKPTSPAAKRAGERSGEWDADEAAEAASDAAGAAAGSCCARGVPAEELLERPASPAEGAEGAFDRAELLELLLGHASTPAAASASPAASTSEAADPPPPPKATAAATEPAPAPPAEEGQRGGKREKRSLSAEMEKGAAAAAAQQAQAQAQGAPAAKRRRGGAVARAC